jgi:hypothetical protein
MDQLSRQFAVLVPMVCGLVAIAVAWQKPEPAPILKAEPIPGKLDIGFRSDGWKFTGCSTARKGFVKVEASGVRSLSKSSVNCDKNVKDPTGVAVYGASRAANVLGNLLVQLDHQRWMIRSTLLGESPTDSPSLEVSAT